MEAKIAVGLPAPDEVTRRPVAAERARPGVNLCMLLVAVAGLAVYLALPALLVTACVLEVSSR